MEQARIIFDGDVQDVAFRKHVKNIADSLKIVGHVKNRKDGTVKAVCEGEREDIELLISKVKETPSLATITGISATYVNTTGKYKSFRIKYGKPMIEFINITSAGVRQMKDINSRLDSIKSKVEETNNKIEETNNKIEETNNTMREGFKNVNNTMREGFKNVNNTMREEFKNVNNTMREEFKNVNNTMREEFKNVNNRLEEINDSIRETNQGSMRQDDSITVKEKRRYR